MRVDPANVLVTTGSQQALDLLGKVLIDAQFLRDGPGHRLAIPGQHCHLDTPRVQLVHRRLALRPDRVGQRKGCQRPLVLDQEDNRLTARTGLI